VFGQCQLRRSLSGAAAAQRLAPLDDAVCHSPPEDPGGAEASN
jgi:hypothetical protein